MKNAIRILHTSDWHIGKKLFGRNRYAEFDAFFSWLINIIDQYNIDVLLVAGDVFDTVAPTNRAQEIYYSFLCNAAETCCRHIVITAGNHDSPTFLDAPKDLLKYLNIHVAGRPCENPADEILLLRDGSGMPELIVGAVPYLRDRDARRAEAGESMEEKERNLVDGIRAHYALCAQEARRLCAELGSEIPAVAMGHLFTSGGKTMADDGVRELYVGGIGHIDAAVFPQVFSYVALGHLHVPQMAGHCGRIRYSGSPLPMGFGEAGQSKSLCLVEYKGSEPEISLVDIPEFQRLETIRGDWDAIGRRMAELSGQGSGATPWLEIIYDGREIIGNLREKLNLAAEGTGLEVLSVRDNRAMELALGQSHEGESLEELSVEEVFKRCLAARGVEPEAWPEYLESFSEVVASLADDDPAAE